METTIENSSFQNSFYVMLHAHMVISIVVACQFVVCYLVSTIYCWGLSVINGKRSFMIGGGL